MQSGSAAHLKENRSPQIHFVTRLVRACAARAITVAQHGSEREMATECTFNSPPALLHQLAFPCDLLRLGRLLGPQAISLSILQTKPWWCAWGGAGGRGAMGGMRTRSCGSSVAPVIRSMSGNSAAAATTSDLSETSLKIKNQVWRGVFECSNSSFFSTNHQFSIRKASFCYTNVQNYRRSPPSRACCKAWIPGLKTRAICQRYPWNSLWWGMLAQLQPDSWKLRATCMNTPTSSMWPMAA